MWGWDGGSRGAVAWVWWEASACLRALHEDCMTDLVEWQQVTGGELSMQVAVCTGSGTQLPGAAAACRSPGPAAHHTQLHHQL